MDNELPPDWDDLHTAAWAAGWSLSAGSAGYRAGWRYDAAQLEGTARRAWATAAGVREWVAGGCVSGYIINEIVTGDARQLAPSIEPGSVSLVFCDPIYQNIEDYAWLAQTALRVLRPGGVCLTWCSVRNAAPCQQAMECAGLDFVYWLFYTVTAKTWRLNRYQMFCWTTPCLWLRKPGADMQLSGWIPDTYHDNTVISSAHPQGSFTWNKNTAVLIKWIEQFSKPGELVFDPFCGTGSIPIACRMTDRRFIASEILPERADEARTRLAATPAYMFAGDAV